jgi:hypothetical protein
LTGSGSTTSFTAAPVLRLRRSSGACFLGATPSCRFVVELFMRLASHIALSSTLYSKTRDTMPALVLEVIARTYDLAERRTQPWYIDRAVLGLGQASESADSSIYHAEVSGWLVGAGESPKSVAITADGVRLLEECWFI